ncbi:MAG TPA: biotin--[acetyl-CoA-carboxylase] ligase [Solirubrobacterales bacterium]|nr:biotin--[acetyl-CoA-carboxylase] ligase [Solirubrobacterales bacterium]
MNAAAGFGRPRRHLRRTDSTNARAKELAEKGGPSGLVVTADEQTAGRGRQGRSWFAPPGTALLYSALVRPERALPLLPLAAPLAVCEAAEAVAPVRCQVKWPNDVWVDGRKLAGILIESRPEVGGGGWTVIGVGLNVAVPQAELPDELRGRTTSLTADGEGGASVAEAMRALNDALGRWIVAPEEEVIGAFRARDALAGRSISWEEGAGTAAGIDSSGHLLVDTATGERIALGAGEVHLTLGVRRS